MIFVSDQSFIYISPAYIECCSSASDDDEACRMLTSARLLINGVLSKVKVKCLFNILVKNVCVSELLITYTCIWINGFWVIIYHRTKCSVILWF